MPAPVSVAPAASAYAPTPATQPNHTTQTPRIGTRGGGSVNYQPSGFDSRFCLATSSVPAYTILIYTVPQQGVCHEYGVQDVPQPSNRSRGLWSAPSRRDELSRKILGRNSAIGVNPCGFVRISHDLRAQAGSQRAKATSLIRLDSSDSSCSVRFILIRLDSSFRLDSFCLVRFVLPGDASR